MAVRAVRALVQAERELRDDQVSVPALWTVVAVKTRDEKIAEAQRLRAKGLTLREIGERMGYPLKTVHQWIYDPDLSKLRARKARYSRRCVDCGVPTDGSGGLKNPRTRCAECAAIFQHESRYWTPEAIIGALQCWADDHDGEAPIASHWLRDGVTAGFPQVSIVQREFGSWNAAIVAAGLIPYETGHYGRDGEDDELCEEIRKRYESGESSNALALEYGCSPSTIVYRVRKAGGEIRTAAEGARLYWERRAA